MDFDFETICIWLSEIPGVEVPPDILDPDIIARCPSRLLPPDPQPRRRTPLAKLDPNIHRMAGKHATAKIRPRGRGSRGTRDVSNRIQRSDTPGQGRGRGSRSSDDGPSNAEIPETSLVMRNRLRSSSIDVTTARVAKEFAPMFKEDSTDPKVVDYTIAVVPTGRMKTAVQDLVDQKGTINQTLQPEARDYPAFCSIETKKGHNDEEDALFKLAMWVIAWQNCINPVTGEGVLCTPLPGFIVLGGDWVLYWIVEYDDRVDIVEYPHSIRSTKTVDGCYRLLKLLRYLCGTWANEVFVPWFNSTVLGLEDSE
ncbi:hypothetical protein K491DRAFT_760318 [Lophiostoma macrostomum CBS 122681]|uniref:PD-(D/E)XK nuclease-like domain-containing protein n=1 Tax=Lophiostoma macrostomum CBS 122681 TaxID=1314788 RepID=A0A6A6SXW2_9PLEO|nr:hypothetical protein K491DRAFT_760318 [Lophiostoma macrostomum CBS 122681]